MNTLTVAISALVIVVTFGVGVFVGNLTANSGNSVKSYTDTMGQAVKNTGDALSGNNTANTNASGTPASNGSAVAFTLSIDKLSDAQKSMLRTMGINSNEIQITNNMVVCAEAKIGSGRLTEIRNGATPSMSEGLSLMSCYSAG